jgi:hypothetical protein
VDWPVAVAIVLLAGGASFAQALTGFGFSLLIVPPLALVIGPKDAVVVANVLSTTVNIVMLTRIHGGVAWGVSGRLLVGALIGMPMGLLVLIYFSPTALQLLIAVTVITFTAALARGLQVRRTGLLGDVGVGIVSGVFNTSTSMSGPPVVLYLQGQGMAPDRFRSTVTAYFFASSGISIPLLALAGRYDHDVTNASLVGLPALLVGIIAGNWVFRRIHSSRFRTLVFGTLIVSAVIAIAAAILKAV